MRGYCKQIGIEGNITLAMTILVYKFLELLE